MKTQGTVTINRSIEEVFDFLTEPINMLDPTHKGRWEIDALEGTALGASFKAAFKVGPFRTTLNWKIVDYYRPIRLAFEISALPFTNRLLRLLSKRRRSPVGEQAFELQQVPEGTGLTEIFNMPGRLTPFMGVGLKRDLRKIKAAIESR